MVYAKNISLPYPFLSFSVLAPESGAFFDPGIRDE